MMKELFGVMHIRDDEEEVPNAKRMHIVEEEVSLLQPVAVAVPPEKEEVLVPQGPFVTPEEEESQLPLSRSCRAPYRGPTIGRGGPSSPPLIPVPALVSSSPFFFLKNVGDSSSPIFLINVVDLYD
jgi:hypothetical protein